MEGTSDVRFNIELRLRDRRSDARPGGEMNDRLRPFRRDSAQNGILVSDIDRVQANVGDECLEIPPFNQRIVKVIKIVDYADRMPFGQQGLYQVRTNESGTSGNQYLHITEGSKLGGKLEVRKEEFPWMDADERGRVTSPA